MTEKTLTNETPDLTGLPVLNEAGETIGRIVSQDEVTFTVLRDDAHAPSRPLVELRVHLALVWLACLGSFCFAVVYRLARFVMSGHAFTYLREVCCEQRAEAVRNDPPPWSTR